ncbi:MAG: amidohydrolase family protein [Candidatus Moranbacteria bacterium]|nr:amidohydrolase family protein [Candidatus Moranbacteria bacterium]
MPSATAYLIKNGTIIDGTGKKARSGQILVRDDKIQALDSIPSNGNYLEIDAQDAIVCPGFIDVNNHSDSYWTLFEYPGQESLLYQGITSIVGGNCGSSLAPIFKEQGIDSIRKYIDISKALVRWETFGQFYDFLNQYRLSLNFASLIGHNTLRRSLIGNQVRPLSKQELKIFSMSLDKALKQGALGLSTGLVYTHAQIASREELVSLAQIVKKHNAVYTTHIRGERQDLLASVKEALKIAQITKVNLQISHLKACGRESWSLQDQVMESIQTKREQGLNINFDVYPYTQAGPVLYTLLPSWAVEGGKHALLKRLKDPAIKQKISQEMQNNDFDYGDIIIGVSKIKYALPRYRVADIAANQGKTSEEVVLDLIISSDDTMTTIIELMSLKNVKKALAHQAAMVATNAAGYHKKHRQTGDLVHPRCFGSIPRFLKKFVLKDKLLSLETAIAKLTRIPAEKFNLNKQIGTLEKNKKADIVVFDPKKIQDRATLKKPFQYSQGIKHLFINGKLAILNYKLTGERSGRVLRPD